MPLNNIIPFKVSGSWENVTRLRGRLKCRRPNEPEPGNTGGGKKLNETEPKHDSSDRFFTSTLIIAEIAIFVSLATALSFIIVYTLPQGGSITLGSMVPIIWLALRRGPKIGLSAGAVYGLIQFAVMPYIVPGIGAVVQVALDYPLAFGVLGLAGFFRNRPVIGAAVAISARSVMHFVSGVVYWAPLYAPELNPFVYSAVYNGSYLLPELVVSGAIIFLLQRSKVLNVYL
jgi:thiamine transporter